MQYWHVSPQCQSSAKCFSGQAWHSVGVSAVQCRFTAVPGGHLSHVRSSDVTGSRYLYVGGTACCWKAQEREAVKSCKRKEKRLTSKSTAVTKISNETHLVHSSSLAKGSNGFFLYFGALASPELPVTTSWKKGQSCKVEAPGGHGVLKWFPLLYRERLRESEHRIQQECHTYR